MLLRAVGAERSDGCRTGRQGQWIKRVNRNGGAKTRAGGCRLTGVVFKEVKWKTRRGKEEEKDETKYSSVKRMGIGS